MRGHDWYKTALKVYYDENMREAVRLRRLANEYLYEANRLETEAKKAKSLEDIFMRVEERA